MSFDVNTIRAQLKFEVKGARVAKKTVRGFARVAVRSFGAARASARQLAIAIGLIISVEAARRLIFWVDRFGILQDRLRAATRQSNDFAHIFQKLFAMSTDLGTPFAANVDLFHGFSRVKADIGFTNEEVLQLTRTVGQLSIIGGATAIQLRNGLLQFRQAISEGIVRAQEMNSWFENVPELAAAIARGLEITQGQFSKMVRKGKLTSKATADAVLKQSVKIEEYWSKIPKRIDREMVGLKDSIQYVFYTMQEAAGSPIQQLAWRVRRLAKLIRDNWIDIYGYIKAGYIRIKILIQTFISNFDGLGGAVANLIKTVSGTSNAWDGLVKGLLYANRGVEYLVLGIKNIWLVAQVAFNGVKQILNTYYQYCIWVAENLYYAFRKTIAQIILLFDKLGLGFKKYMIDLSALFKPEGSDRKALQEWAAELELVELRAKAFAGIQPVKNFVDHLAINGGIKLAEQLSNIFEKFIEAKRQFNEASSPAEGYQAYKSKLALLENELKLLREKGNLSEEAFQAAIALQRIEAQRTLAKGKVVSGIGDIKDPLAKAKTDLDKTRRKFDPTYATKQDYLNNRAILVTALENELITRQNYYMLIEANFNQHQGKMNEIAIQALRDKYKLDTLSGLLSIKTQKELNSMSAKEAGKGFRNQIETAAQHSKKFFELNKALNYAQALIDGFSAVQGAYKFGSVLGGPFLGATFAAVSLAATAVQLAAIQAQTFNPPRAAGGRVNPYSKYRINEKGAEVLSTAKGDYLTTGASGGRITPNSKLGGGVNLNVNIINNASDQVEASSSVGQNGELSILIEAVKSAISHDIARGGGVVENTIRGTYGLRRT